MRHTVYTDVIFLGVKTHLKVVSLLKTYTADMYLLAFSVQCQYIIPLCRIVLQISKRFLMKHAIPCDFLKRNLRISYVVFTLEGFPVWKLFKTS